MQLIISARQFELGDALRKRVERRLGRLARFDSRVTRMEVSLLEEKNQRRVEALLSVDGGSPIHASATATDFRTAVDRLSDRLARQLKKQHSRHRDHQAAPKDVVPPPAVEGP